MGGSKDKSRSCQRRICHRWISLDGRPTGNSGEVELRPECGVEPDYGLNTGADQIFDLVVDSDGNYLLGGHTTAGTTNWDYLAIKVDGATKQQLWRKTFGQPRGFDPGISTTRCGECRWIPRATTSCWEDPETSIPTVQNLEAGPATSGSPTSWWSARTGTSSTRASTAARLGMKLASTSRSPAPATS